MWLLSEDEGATTRVPHVVAECEACAGFGPRRVLHSLRYLVGHLQGIQVCKKQLMGFSVGLFFFFLFLQIA